MAVDVIAAARVARAVVLGTAVLLILSYVAGAVIDAGARTVWLAYGGITVVLLVLPLPALLRGNARGGFWYALVSTLFAAHGVVLAVVAATRTVGLVVLGSALVLFLAGGLFLRLAHVRG